MSKKINLKLKRVSYGKKDTPENLREYTVVGLGEEVVGTIAEFKSYFLEANVQANFEVIE